MKALDTYEILREFAGASPYLYSSRLMEEALAVAVLRCLPAARHAPDRFRRACAAVIALRMDTRNDLAPREVEIVRKVAALSDRGDGDEYRDHHVAYARSVVGALEFRAYEAPGDDVTAQYAIQIASTSIWAASTALAIHMTWQEERFVRPFVMASLGTQPDGRMPPSWPPIWHPDAQRARS